MWRPTHTFPLVRSDRKPTMNDRDRDLWRRVSTTRFVVKGGRRRWGRVSFRVPYVGAFELVCFSFALPSVSGAVRSMQFSPTALVCMWLIFFFFAFPSCLFACPLRCSFSFAQWYGRRLLTVLTVLCHARCTVSIFTLSLFAIAAKRSAATLLPFSKWNCWENKTVHNAVHKG